MGIMFVFGFIASTSQMMFVALAWALAFLLGFAALLVWLVAQFQRRHH